MENKELAVRENVTLEKRIDDSREIIRKTIAPGLSEPEFELYLAVAKHSQLDPVVGEIYAVPRGKGSDRKLTFITSIDALRRVAIESGECAGQLGPYWCGEDGEWKDIWLKNIPPVAAKVGVLRMGCTEPFWGVARYAAYKPDQNDFMWKKMPDNQIAKCAEALAYRKAFPKNLSRIYTRDEMEQADNMASGQSSKPPITPPKKRELTEAEIKAGKEIDAMLEEMSANSEIRAKARELFKTGVEVALNYTTDEYTAFLDSKKKAEGK